MSLTGALIELSEHYWCIAAWQGLFQILASTEQLCWSHSDLVDASVFLGLLNRLLTEEIFAIPRVQWAIRVSRSAWDKREEGAWAESTAFKEWDPVVPPPLFHSFIIDWSWLDAATGVSYTGQSRECPCALCIIVCSGHVDMRVSHRLHAPCYRSNFSSA